MKNRLLSFVGFHDPYYSSGMDKLDAPGPIISMLNARPFDELVLFNTPGTQKAFHATCEAVTRHFPNIRVIHKDLDSLNDPTDHIAILRYLRRYIAELLDEEAGMSWYVSISSGTPSMHACWLLLAAEGVLPARLIYGHPPKTGLDAYPISEVNLDAPEFPDISPRMHLAAGQMQAVTPIPCDMAREMGMIGENALFLDAVEKSGKLARYDGHLLLLGETGVGKERFADLIHRLSSRAKHPLTPVNCGALPADLAESLLFGHKKGAFTGAIADQRGAFDDADGGTLFLDEIGDTPIQVQAKLLRALQSGEIRPLGAAKNHKVNVRVVAATHVDLAAAIKESTFRADLYQRFSASVRIPSLRQRRDDIPRLALFALTAWNRRHNEQKRFSKKALARLVEYDWPGNVRELIHAVENAAILAPKTILEPDDLSFDSLIRDTTPGSAFDPHEGFSIRAYLDSEYQRLLQRALELTHGNQRQAARLLGITPQAVNVAIGKKQFEG